jgi:hypothetical protein
MPRRSGSVNAREILSLSLSLSLSLCLSVSLSIALLLHSLFLSYIRFSASPFIACPPIPMPTSSIVARRVSKWLQVWHERSATVAGPGSCAPLKSDVSSCCLCRGSGAPASSREGAGLTFSTAEQSPQIRPPHRLCARVSVMRLLPRRAGEKA